MKKCDKCYYQEFYNMEFVCAHICSMEGIEALEDHKKCRIIKSL